MPDPAALIATWFGVGRLPRAPGTWGSLAALPCAFALHYLGGFPLFAAASVGVFCVGLWATRAYMEKTGIDDPGEVVVDEVVGQWIALWPLSAGLTIMQLDPWVFPWPGWVSGFLLFRFFDIAKPWPINWLDRRPGAWGVMLDDALAGVFAGGLVLLGAYVAHSGWRSM